MKEITLKVEGMVCNGCENRVKNALEGLSEVESVVANFKEGTVIVKGNNLEQNKLEDKIEDIGFTVIKD